MKKTVVVLGLLAMTISSFAQIEITHSKDEMTNEVSYFASERFIVANSELTKGCAIDMVIDEKAGILTSKHIFVEMVGLESCNENNTLIFLLNGDRRITLKSWNKFNCKGAAYFTLTKTDIDLLKSNQVLKVRIENGKSYKNYTSEVKYKKYFIEFYNALNN